MACIFPCVVSIEHTYSDYQEVEPLSVYERCINGAVVVTHPAAGIVVRVEYNPKLPGDFERAHSLAYRWADVYLTAKENVGTELCMTGVCREIVKLLSGRNGTYVGCR